MRRIPIEGEVPTMKLTKTLAIALCATALPATMLAQDSNGNSNGCGKLPSYAQLKTALTAAVAAEASGLDLQMWGTIVDRDGVSHRTLWTERWE
jgi:hypothetical protein